MSVRKLIGAAKLLCVSRESLELKVENKQGIINLCKIAEKLLSEMEINAATKFAIRTVLREAVNKSCPKYRGNNNKLNVRFISDAARTAIECGSDEKLISDHIRPISIMLSEIYSKQIKCSKELVELCKNYSEMCLITKSEDALLTSNGLASSMPSDWDGVDKYARYTSVNISFTEAPEQSK